MKFLFVLIVTIFSSQNLLAQSNLGLNDISILVPLPQSPNEMFFYSAPTAN